MIDAAALWVAFLSLAENIFWAGIAALGFAVIFNVPVRTLFACALCGAVAYATRTLLAQFAGLGIEAATLVGATLVGFLAVLLGRIWHVPAPVLVMPGVIPLIPGALAFRTMIDLLNLSGAPAANETLVAVAAVNTFKTALIIAAIAAGVAIPSLLFRRHQPMT